MDLDQYYDFDSILAEHTKVPCIALCDFEKDVNLLGDETPVSRNTRIELPYWVAKPLAQYTSPSEGNLIVVEMPKTYGTRVRNMLLASPESVDFRSLSGYYYEFGVKLIEFLIDDQLPHIIDKSSGSTIGIEFIQRLDETEKDLYRLGQQSASDFRKWLDRAIYKIKNVDIASNRSFT